MINDTLQALLRLEEHAFAHNSEAWAWARVEQEQLREEPCRDCIEERTDSHDEPCVSCLNAEDAYYPNFSPKGVQ